MNTKQTALDANLARSRHQRCWKGCTNSPTTISVIIPMPFIGATLATSVGWNPRSMTLLAIFGGERV